MSEQWGPAERERNIRLRLIVDAARVAEAECYAEDADPDAILARIERGQEWPRPKRPLAELEAEFHADIPNVDRMRQLKGTPEDPFKCGHKGL